MLKESFIVVVYIIKVPEHLLNALAQLNIFLSHAQIYTLRLVLSLIRSSQSSFDLSLIFTFDTYLLSFKLHHHFLIFSEWNFHFQLALSDKFFDFGLMLALFALEKKELPEFVNDHPAKHRNVN